MSEIGEKRILAPDDDVPDADEMREAARKKKEDDEKTGAERGAERVKKQDEQEGTFIAEIDKKN